MAGSAARRCIASSAGSGRWSGCFITSTASWGQGLEINDFPPSVKYLFSKQIVDESTHEILYMDLLLKKRFVANQKAAFADPACAFQVNSSLAYYVFTLRNLATYPHTIRIAALNLGPKILELAWSTALAEATDDAELKGVFESQIVENRSHVNMGRRIVEEFIAKPVDAEFARWAVGIAKRDYCRYLREVTGRRIRPPAHAATGAARSGFRLRETSFDRATALVSHIRTEAQKIIDEIDCTLEGQRGKVFDWVRQQFVIVPRPFNSCYTRYGFGWTLPSSDDYVNHYYIRRCEITKELDESDTLEDIKRHYWRLSKLARRFNCVRKILSK